MVKYFVINILLSLYIFIIICAKLYILGRFVINIAFVENNGNMREKWQNKLSVIVHIPIFRNQWYPWVPLVSHSFRGGKSYSKWVASTKRTQEKVDEKSIMNVFLSTVWFRFSHNFMRFITSIFTFSLQQLNSTIQPQFKQQKCVKGIHRLILL